MQSGFTGMGTSALYGKMLMDLLALACSGLAAGAERVHGLMRLATRGGPLVPDGVADVLQEAVASGRLKPSTGYKYLNAITQFIAWFGDGDLADASPATVGEFLSTRRTAGVRGGARRVDLSALRTVLDKFLGYDATGALQYPPPSVPVTCASSEQVLNLLASAADDTDRLLVLMLNIMKLRPGQLVALRGSDIDWETCRLTVRRGQAGTCRSLAIPEELVVLMKRVSGEHGDAWLFQSSRQPGSPVTVRALQKRLARIAGRCGIETTCTALRKAEAVELGGVCVRPETQTGSVGTSVDHEVVPTWLELSVRVSAARERRVPLLSG